MKLFLTSIICSIFLGFIISFGVIEKPQNQECYSSSIDTIDGMKALLLEQESIRNEIHNAQRKIEGSISKVENIEGRVLGVRHGYIETAVETDTSYHINYYKK